MSNILTKDEDNMRAAQSAFTPTHYTCEWCWCEIRVENQQKHLASHDSGHGNYIYYRNRELWDSVWVARREMNKADYEALIEAAKELP